LPPLRVNARKRLAIGLLKTGPAHVMWKPLAIALVAACGNAIFVYGQRVAGHSPNPFLYMLGCVGFGWGLFLIATLAWQSPDNLAYLSSNAGSIALGGIGFFITFLGFYLLYSGFGASQYTLYATLSILTTSLGVGVLVFREPLNSYQVVAMLLAVASIGLWSYGRSIGG
jgi:drug/metabolite transporter (DMT)-like permease